MDRVIAVIIGRAGSKGLPGKNSRLVAGRPMVCHSIDHARAATAVDRVIVSTDCSMVAAAARGLGVTVVDRPDELATDHAAVDDTARHAVEAAMSTAPIVVILYANVPARPPGLIDQAVTMLNESGADSVQSYQDVGKHHPCWMVRLDEHDRVEPYDPSTIHRRQDLPPLLIPDGGVIAVHRTSLFAPVLEDPHTFLGRDRRGLVNEPGSVIDVDTEIDAMVAEAVLARPSLGAVAC